MIVKRNFHPLRVWSYIWREVVYALIISILVWAAATQLPWGASLAVNFTPNWFPPDQPAPHALGAFLQQYWTYISMASLVGGFLLASMGSYYINRFARRRWPGSKLIERPDEVLERSMKGFDDKYAYFSYSLPAPYMLVGPSGIQSPHSLRHIWDSLRLSRTMSA